VTQPHAPEPRAFANDRRAYDRLRERFARIATIGEAASVLSWDASAMMPPGGGAARGDQLAVLAGLAHGLLIEAATADDLAEAEAASADPDLWDVANLRLMRHAHTRATAVPASLVEAQVRANSACEKVWREARATSDFALVAPALGEVVRLVREAASALAPALGLEPYDALMDGFQRGIAAADVAPVFADYEAFLRRALPEAEARQAARPAPLRPAGPFAEAVQEVLCRRMSERIGLDYAHARLDRSAHPFSGGTPTDVRITTRYDEADFTQSLLGVLHETGHALYERGLPELFARQPVGEAAGMAAHESQSLIIEMQACRSDEFLRFLAPELHAAFGGDPAPYAPPNLARLWRRIGRGFIRVEADEMTYPAHVILRFRLEQALIADDLAVADLPGAWNDGMRELLGIMPTDDARGCLQDIHWYDGAFGYFPSYTLGAMAAAQLMAAARRAVPGLSAALETGDLTPLLTWLRENVHAKGSLLGFNDLLREATGKTLDPNDFEIHLTERYLV
jgi:carboxypeptidase Taq